MTAPPQVLIVSRDQLLLRTRRWILERYFAVSDASGIQEAEAQIARNNFALIILCHTIPSDECQRFVTLIESRKPVAKIVLLSAGLVTCLPAEMQYFATPDAGPESLLRTAAKALDIEWKPGPVPVRDLPRSH